jgi:thiol-disulfide isomerase/thioredoxin
MTRKLVVLILVFFLYVELFAQTITGNLSQLAKQEIRLEGFNGLTTYPIATTTSDEKGNFSLRYTKEDIGVGYLMSVDNKPLFIILSGEDITLQGEALSYVETIKIIKGQQNIGFEQYATAHPKREQALSAWLYLEKMYAEDSLFNRKGAPIQAIADEKLRINQEDAAFLNSLPENSYVRWFLPARKLVSSVSTVAQYRTEEIPATFAAFRNLDYTDQRLYKSGLFKDAIESHFWLLENSGRSLDSVFIEMKISIDSMMTHLLKNETRLNEVTDHLFKLLEQHSLFEASEYLALKVLNQSSCTINSDLAKQLETYRAMKIGNIAPDIEFGRSGKPFSKLSDVKTKYKLVVFGSSWCPKCVEEIPRLKDFYTQWKSEYDLEIALISLDTDQDKYAAFTKDFPWINFVDYKSWEGEAARDYYVFGTPTMFLLDTTGKILLKPVSADHVNAWIQAKEKSD